MRISKAAIGLIAVLFSTPVMAQSILNEDGTFTLLPQAAALQSALSSSSVTTEDLATFYEDRSYVPVWVGHDARRAALISALRESDAQGLPLESYGVDELELMTNATLDEPALRAQVKGLLLADDAVSYFDALLPKTKEYQALIDERARLKFKIAKEHAVALIPKGRMMRPGYKGARVVMVRERLSVLGYGFLGTSDIYDELLVEVVRSFQEDNKLTADAVMGPATVGAMNKSSSDRMAQVLVNLERQRWMNHNRSGRHIEVNLADFTMSVIDDERVTFTSKVVVGKTGRDFRTPEFSKDMSHLIVNPFWHVPKSIATREYLPMLKQDPMALTNRGLWLMNRRGQVLNTAGADLSSRHAGEKALRSRPSRL